MDIKYDLKVLYKTSWIKTLYFNLHYFGMEGFKLPVLVSRNIRLRKTRGRVILGENRCGKVFLGRDDCSHITGKGIWDNEGTVTFWDKCFLGNGTKISVLKEGSLSIGKEVYITGESRILCERSITIESGTIISWDTTIMDSDQHSIFNEEHQRINEPKPIHIGAKSWIGMGAVILKGCILPKECIIAAGSIVSKEFHESNCVIGGTNQILRKNSYWKS